VEFKGKAPGVQVKDGGREKKEFVGESRKEKGEK